MCIRDRSWAEWVDTRALIDQLEAERREALILTQVLGYTYAEAAKIANVRVGTIRSRVARARADLVEMAGEGQGGVTKKEKTEKNKRRFGLA